MKKYLLGAVCMAAGLNLIACAEYPGNISAAYIPSIIYKGATCYELNQERVKLTNHVVAVAKQQRKTANIDTALVGSSLFIAGGALAGLPFTRDQHAQLSVAKGHYDALMAAGRNQNCGPEFNAHSSDSLDWKTAPGEFPPL